MRTRNLFLVILFMLSAISCVNNHEIEKEPAFIIESGDLLFQDLDCGPLCDAIEDVTQGVDGARLSHVGIAFVDQQNQTFVIEAYGSQVVQTPIDIFLSRTKDSNGNPKVIVGRIKDQYKDLINPALQCTKSLIGKPYDNIFKIDSNNFYCSELVFYSYMMANSGKPLFLLLPMTFKDVNSSQFNDAWVEYYKNLKHAIPEGEPGINPGDISRSQYVHIVHAFGYPDGYSPVTKKE